MGNRFLGIRMRMIKLDHTIDMKADQQLEVIVGSDRIARINVDGVCVLRVRCASDAEIRIDTPVELILVDGEPVLR